MKLKTMNSFSGFGIISTETTAITDNSIKYD